MSGYPVSLDAWRLCTITNSIRHSDITGEHNPTLLLECAMGNECGDGKKADRRVERDDSVF